MSYTVVLIEPRKHRALLYVIRNILENLDDRWNLLIFYGNKNKDYLDTIIRGLEDTLKPEKRIILRSLGVDNLNITEYNEFIGRPEFYRSLPTNIILFVQTDSMIIPRNKELVYNFLHYDYVGAPWSGDIDDPQSSKGVGNGGFSLRNCSAMITLFEEHPFKHALGNEDFHISKYAKNKPSLMDALSFSTESLLWESFGVHFPWKYIQMRYLEEKYPFIGELIALQEVET